MNDAEKNAQDVQFAIEELLRMAKRRGIIVCGFAFGGVPLAMINFGNCNDAGDLKLYEVLTEFCNNQRNKGLVNKIDVGEVN